MTSRHERRARRHAVDRLPDLVELVVIAVRAGSTPTAAILAVSPLAPTVLKPALDEVVHRIERGQRLADAIVAMSEALGPPAADFVDALATTDRYGLPIGPVLDRLSDEIRLERRRAVERQARTLPVRLAFPLVTCTLPSFVLVAIAPALLGAVSTLTRSSP
jgi:tight adherence protein C